MKQEKIILILGMFQSNTGSLAAGASPFFKAGRLFCPPTSVREWNSNRCLASLSKDLWICGSLNLNGTFCTHSEELFPLHFNKFRGRAGKVAAASHGCFQYESRVPPSNITGLLRARNIWKLLLTWKMRVYQAWRLVLTVPTLRRLKCKIYVFEVGLA